MRPLIFIVLALAAGTCLAQGPDPLKSPACLQALDALQAQEAAMVSSARTARRLSAAQQDGLRWSLTASALHANVSARKIRVAERTPRPPVAVAPVTRVALGSACQARRLAAAFATRPAAAVEDRHPMRPVRVLDERRRPPESPGPAARRAAGGLHGARRRADLSIAMAERVGISVRSAVSSSR